jgi:hypothetical protein
LLARVLNDLCDSCRMINAGEVTASINEQAGMVEFQQASALATRRLLPHLQERISKISMLQERLQAAGRQAILDAEDSQPAGGRGEHLAFQGGDASGDFAPRYHMHPMQRGIFYRADLMAD